MAFIKAEKLKHKFVRRDEQGEIEDVTLALDDVNIEVEEGQFIAVLGHNGSGKSTFAKHLNALLTPSEGTVWVDGKDTSKEENILDIRKEAGMIFQNPDNQIVAGVVEEDVAFGPENIGVPTEEIWERVGKSLESVGMTAYRYHSPNRLSGGQKQRVAIAGVVAMEPKCIIMDEPTAMLDPVGRNEVVSTIHELNDKFGVTVVLITHHMREATEADRVVVMNDGKIIADDTPKKVFSQVELLRDVGLTVPETTDLMYELNARGWNLPLDALSVEECARAIYQEAANA